MLSRNPNALHILEKNIDKIEWTALSKNPSAIYLLEKNRDKIEWNALSSNPNAIRLYITKIKMEKKFTDYSLVLTA